MSHIVIIGYKGSGKTRVGKRLAQDLDLPFIDLDRIITQKMNMSVKDIYQRFGEPYYRALETFVLKDMLANRQRQIISIGAGCPVQDMNREILGKIGNVIYIKGSFETLKKRRDELNPDAPQSDERDEKMKKQMKLYDPIYASLANIQVVTGIKQFDDLISEIEEKLTEVWLAE